MSLRTYVIRRTINSLILILACVVFNFFLFRLQVFLLGVDPAKLAFGANPKIEQTIIDAVRRKWGIPAPDAGFDAWTEYFFKYMTNMLTFNFGTSFLKQEEVSVLIAQKMPNTVILLGTASIFTIILGIVLGVSAASRQGGRWDMGLIATSLTVYSLPVFWIGMLFIMVFGSYLGWFPVSGGTHSIKCSQPGACDPIENTIDLLYHMVLPTATLTIGGFGGYLLLMRNNLIDVLTEDYIITARAKGLPENTVLYKHAFRNAVLPMVTVIALTFAFVISGAVLTETIFSWSGLGVFIFESLIQNDWPSAEAVFLLIAITVIIANFVADILYGVLDPRIKYS